MWIFSRHFPLSGEPRRVPMYKYLYSYLYCTSSASCDERWHVVQYLHDFRNSTVVPGTSTDYWWQDHYRYLYLIVLQYIVCTSTPTSKNNDATTTGTTFNYQRSDVTSTRYWSTRYHITPTGSNIDACHTSSVSKPWVLLTIYNLYYTYRLYMTVDTWH